MSEQELSLNDQQKPDEIDDRALPIAEFWVLHKRFEFTIDVAAAVHNAKLPRYVTKEQDGLSISWTGERVYCNPPFSNIRPWVKKSWQELDALLIVMLLPANRTDQTWWHDWIEPRRDRPGSPLRVEFLPTRQRFLKAAQTLIGSGRPPFGCCLCIWNHPTP